MSQSTRAPLPERPIPQEIVGNDTRAQAAENRRRISDYLDLLRTTAASLPADPTQPDRLGTAQVAREAGVSLGILRPGHPLRKKVEGMISELGLAVIHIPPARDDLTVGDCHSLFLRLAPAKAKKMGIRSEAMSGFVNDLFQRIRDRSKDGDSTSIAPLIAELREDAVANLLDLEPHVLRIIKTFDDWIALSVNPGRAISEEALSAMAFHDLLRLGMENAGLSQARAAGIAGIRQPTLHKWLHEQRFPNQRSFDGLRKLAEYFGFPSEALIHSITRSRGGAGYHFRPDDFPAEHRGKSSKRLREAVRACLTDDDFQLSTETFRARLADLCAELQGAFKSDLDRKKMRDANRIVRDRFSEQLVAELAGYCDDLALRGRKTATQDSYLKHLEGFFSFALSDAAPTDLRLDPAKTSITHAAARGLWHAYFAHLTEIGRTHTGPGFRISRAIVERTTAVAAMFAEDGYIDRTPTLLSCLDDLSGDHLPKNRRRSWATLEAAEKLEAIYLDLRKFRNVWIKDGSKPPVSGRYEIADLLAVKNPMIAVTQIILHLRRKKEKLRKWEKNDKKRLNHHYATALRKLVLVHLLGQTAFRIGMVPSITFGKPGCHLQWPKGGKPCLTIPAEMFKNGAGVVFKDGPYQRELEDRNGCYADLEEYRDLARPRLLDDKDDNHLFLSWSAGRGGRAVSAQVTRHEITAFTADAIGINAPPEQRLIRIKHLRPHHFRDILATSVLRKTNRNFALAGDAIHVTEETARQYYAYDTVEQRRPELQKILASL